MKKLQRLINKIVDWIYNLPIFDIPVKTERKLFIGWLILTGVCIISQVIRFLTAAK